LNRTKRRKSTKTAKEKTPKKATPKKAKTVKEKAPKKRKKETKSFERVLESAKKLQQKRKFVPREIKDAKAASDGDEDLNGGKDQSKGKQKPAAKKQKITENVNPLASAIGLENLDQRIKNSQATEFTVERTFFLKHTRYLPFGTTAYYQNAADFYSKPCDLCCLHCTEKFSTLPLPVPYRYTVDASDRDDFLFWVHGQCCTPSCLMAHAPEKKPLISLMLKKIYNLPITKNVVPAPDKRALAKFGGMLSIEQFRATGASGITTHLNMPPFLPISAGIVEIEKTETVVRESGGAELARRRVRGRATFSNFAPFQSAVVKTQKARFATAPTIDEQIRQSDEMMRLQIGDELYKKRKNATILSFLKK
jgi:hypothetical protein